MHMRILEHVSKPRNPSLVTKVLSRVLKLELQAYRLPPIEDTIKFMASMDRLRLISLLRRRSRIVNELGHPSPNDMINKYLRDMGEAGPSVPRSVGCPLTAV